MNNLVKTSRILVAAMFILSALSKMLSLPFFDGLVAELIIGADYYNHPDPLFYTQLLTRFLIAAELVLGIALLQEFWLKKVVIPSVMLMLLLFTIHLFYEGFRSEKGFIEGNCGCFGDILPMNNLESILKNVAAILLGGFVWWKYKPEEEMKFAGWLMPTVLGVVTMGTLLLTVKDYDSKMEEEIDYQETSQVDTNDQLSQTKIDTAEAPKNTTSVEKNDNPVQSKTTESSSDKVETYSKTIKMLSNLPKLSDGSTLNVKSGKHLVCMFSMTCGHCQETIKEICKAKDGGWPPITLLNFGKEFEQKYFFSQAGNCKYPHLLTEDYMQFNKWLEGEGFPRILAIENGKVVKSWDIDSYSKESLFKFYGIKEAKSDNQLITPPKKTDDDPLEKKNPWD